MVSWQDFNIIILTLVVMQISIIIVVLTHTGVINVSHTADKPSFRNTVAYLPKPAASPSIFAPTDSLCEVDCNQ